MVLQKTMKMMGKKKQNTSYVFGYNLYRTGPLDSERDPKD